MSEKQPTGRFCRPCRSRRVIGLALLLMLLVGVAVGFAVTRSQVITSTLERELSRMTGGEVTLRDGRMTLSGALLLEGLALHLPDTPRDAGLLLRIDRLSLRIGLRDLLSGRVMPRSLNVAGVTVYLTEDLAAGGYTWSRLRPLESPEAESDEPSPDRAWPAYLPDVVLRHAAVVLGEVENGVYRRRDAVGLAATLTPIPGEAASYGYSVRETGLTADLDAIAQAAPSEVLVTGHIDLGQRSVQARMSGFAIRQRHRQWLPAPWRSWWDQMAPEGRLADARISVEADGLRSPTVALTVEDGRAQLPLEGLDHRLELSQARLILEDGAVRVERLIGECLNARFDLTGAWDSLDPSAPLNVEGTIQGVIPQDPDYLHAMPQVVKDQFYRLQPSGPFLARLDVRRTEPGGPIRTEVDVDVTGLSILYHQFRYPISQIHGQVRILPGVVELVGLEGRGPSGGTIRLDGRIAPPGDGAEVTLDIVATDMPVDMHLVAAMEAKHRPIIDKVMSATGWRWLEQLGPRGLIESSSPDRTPFNALAFGDDERMPMDQVETLARQAWPPGPLPESEQSNVGPSAWGEPGDPAWAPADHPVQPFDLGGRVDVGAHIYRPLGADSRYSSRVIVKPRKANLVIRWWPYPIQVTGGQIEVSQQGAIVRDVVARGLMGGDIRVNGTLAGDQSDSGVLKPDLEYEVEGLPIDPFLLAAISPTEAAWLGALGLEGAVDATGRVYVEDNGQIGVEVLTRVTGGKARLAGGEWVLDPVNARVNIRRGDVEIESVEARREDATVTLSGRLQVAESNLRLNLNATSLRLEDPLLDLAPQLGLDTAALKALQNQHQPRGAFDLRGDVVLSRERGLDYELTFTPRNVSLELRGERVALTTVAGGMRLSPGVIRLIDWRGEHSEGQGAFLADGEIRTDDQQLDVSLTLDARNQSLGLLERTVLPDAVLGVIDGLELGAQYNMVGAHLSYSRRMTGSSDQAQIADVTPQAEPDASTEAPPPKSLDETDFAFTGLIQLREGRALVGVPITELEGEVLITANSVSDATWPHLDVRLTASRLRAAAREARQVEARLATDPDEPASLEVRRLQGEMYQGRLHGEGEIRLGEQGQYALRLSLLDAGLNGVIYPEADPADAPALRGALSADLTIAGQPGQPDSLRGRGGIQVRHANLHELPFTLTLMHLVNLRLPTNSSFDRSDIRFVIDGETARIQAVRMESSSLAIEGAGVMNLTDLSLNLAMRMRAARLGAGAAGRAIGLIQELFDLFKDEIIAIEVAGTLGDPQTRVRPLRTVTQTMRRVINEPKELQR